MSSEKDHMTEESLEQEEVKDKKDNKKKQESGSKKHKEEVKKLNESLEESKEKYLRLYAEFENYRRRTARERLELVETANATLITALLPVLDDFERAIQASEKSQDFDTLKQGVELIKKKLFHTLEQSGLKPMSEASKGSAFDAELHEAITQTPAPEENLKGKIIDVLEKGYYLGEKVIRFAKVVIGS